MSNPVYGSRTLKRGPRRTKAEMLAIRSALCKILRKDRPQSVRHAFYQLCGAPWNLVEKSESGYRTTQQQLLHLRENGEIPWEWIADGTRWRRQVDSYGSVAEAIRATAQYYRKDLWRQTPAYVEVWCESDSIAGTIVEETDRYGVPLMATRGFSSRTFLHSAAKEIERINRPAFLYYVGDWDPAGKLIPEKIEEQLRRFAPRQEITFERLLVTRRQIRLWDLPTKPAKRTTHSKGFVGGTVEAEAIPAQQTRDIVREAIERHLDMREVAVLEQAESSERQDLFALADELVA